jgi:hypothetical protein
MLSNIAASSDEQILPPVSQLMQMASEEKTHPVGNEMLITTTATLSLLTVTSSPTTAFSSPTTHTLNPKTNMKYVHYNF